MRRQRATDREIAALAGAQHGVVARRQLLAFGLSPQSVDRRVHGGRLHVVHRGVYAVGHPVLAREGRWMAAVLVAGPGAVLSHETAAAAWDLRPSAGAIHLTVPGTAGRKRRRGLRIHRSTTLDQATTVRGIPVTSPLRTIVDLATVLEGRPLEHAVDLADQRGLVDFAELRARPLPRSLQAVLALYAQTITRSELEERFLALCDEHRLPRPLTNTVVEGREVDFVWHHARLIVEVDGYRYHRSPSRFEGDRERDVTLSLAGWTVLRFTYTQVVKRPAWVAAAVANHLAR